MKLAVEYPYLVKDRDRHGNVRYYLRRKGNRKIRIPGKPGTSDFQAAYDAARALTKATPVARINWQPKPGTFRWLCVRFFGSTDFKQLDPKTQTVRRRVLENVCAEVVAPGAAETFADFPINRLTSKAVRVLRDRKLGLPEAANVRIKAVRQVFKWAIEEQESGVTVNPARDVKYLKGRQGGHHSWSVDEFHSTNNNTPLVRRRASRSRCCSTRGSAGLMLSFSASNTFAAVG